MGLFGRKKKHLVVDIMLSMITHPSDVLMTGPDNIRDWSERALCDERPKWKLAPDAKTGLIMAPGKSLSQIKNDLPEQMQKFMKSEGFDPRLYSTECFTDHLGRDDMKCMFMTASRRTQAAMRPESTERHALPNEEMGHKTGQVPLRATPPAGQSDTTKSLQVSRVMRDQARKLRADIEKEMEILSYLVDCSKFGEFSRQNVEAYFDMDGEMASRYTEEIREGMLNADTCFAAKTDHGRSLVSGYEQVRLMLVESHGQLVSKFAEIYTDLLPHLAGDEADAHIRFLKDLPDKLSKIQQSVAKNYGQPGS